MIFQYILFVFLQILPTGVKNITGASTASTSNYLAVKKGYVMSYNGNDARANWVSWTLSYSDLGPAERSNRFREDDTLPSNFKKADSDDYRQSGYDRGHLCNSEDRSSNDYLNEETFLMSNMLPQTPQLNRGPWKRLEEYCRKLAKRGQKLTIYAGGIGRIGRIGEVVIPSHCWKVVFTPEKTWCILIPNEHYLNPNWQTYSVPINELEKLIGAKF